MESQFIRFPTMQLDGGGSLVSTIFTFYPVKGYGACHPLCQLIKKGSKRQLDSCFAHLMGHLMEKLSGQVKLSFGDSWFSHVGHFICSITLLCRVRASNLIFHLL